MRVIPSGAASVAVAIAVSGALAQDASSQSSQAVQELTRALDAHKLEAIAAADPSRPNRFVAALYYPGAQLLVVAADYAVPEQMQGRLKERQFREAYIDLQSAGARDAKMFVTDLQADGLRRDRRDDEPFDIVYRNGEQYMSYDGNPSRQKVSEAEYNRRFAQDDVEYAHMLQVLRGGLQQPTSP